MAAKTFKIVLIGDSGVGKTTFLHKYQTGEFKDSHSPTIGVEVKNIKFKTNFGKYIFQVWDCAGDDNRSGLCDAYWLRADALFVMFDVTSRSSFDSVETWIREFVRLGKFVPLVICGNKCDKERTVTLEDIKNRFALDRNKKIAYYDISVKEGQNIKKPFLFLLESLTGQETKLSILMELIRKEKRRKGDNRICQGIMRKIVTEVVRF